MTREENLKFREEVIKNQFKNALGYELNLDNPKTFNEKIQWLKLYYHDPLTTICADKYLARDYIKKIIDEEYLVPLLGVWDKVDDIDFDSLPNQFVLKTNWGAGQVIIVRDKTKINIEETKNKLKYWMQPFCNLYYYYSFEWQYKNIPPKIICEKYIEQSDNQVYDYKVFCFNGKARYIQVDMDRFTGHKRCIYDTNWNKQQFITGNFQFYSGHINKPYHLDSMIKISEKLAKNFSHVRVDFYEVNNKLFLGELTFTHGNGMERFSIEEWDYKFGELLELPKEKKIEYDILDKDTLFKQVYDLEPISRRYRDMEIQLNKQNAILKNNNIEKLNREISKLKFKKEQLRLTSNWFTLFGISNNSEYLRLVIFGIKLTIKINESKVAKLSKLIPTKTLKNKFINKILDQIRPDQTRPDQTRPDQTRPDH